MEYKGYVLTSYYFMQRSEFVCVDEARDYTAESKDVNNGNLWYTTEYMTGSLPMSVFDTGYEATCAQCTDVDYSSTYVRWGHRDCPVGAMKMYTGYAAAGHHSASSGGGYNTVCLHPSPTHLDHKAGMQGGGRLYGTEYKGTKNQFQDAVCTVCAASGSTYTQWGSHECPSNQRMEYKGYIMSNRWNWRSDYVCVDEARDYTVESSSAQQSGNYWYETAYKPGSLPTGVYDADYMPTCAQCTAAE